MPLRGHKWGPHSVTALRSVTECCPIIKSWTAAVPDSSGALPRAPLGPLWGPSCSACGLGLGAPWALLRACGASRRPLRSAVAARPGLRAGPFLRHFGPFGPSGARRARPGAGQSGVPSGPCGALGAAPACRVRGPAPCFARGRRLPPRALGSVIGGPGRALWGSGWGAGGARLCRVWPSRLAARLWVFCRPAPRPAPQLPPLTEGFPPAPPRPAAPAGGSGERKADSEVTGLKLSTRVSAGSVRAVRRGFRHPRAAGGFCVPRPAGARGRAADQGEGDFSSPYTVRATSHCACGKIPPQGRPRSAITGGP